MFNTDELFYGNGRTILNSFIRGTILCKGGARIEDLKIFGKLIAKKTKVS